MTRAASMNGSAPGVCQPVKVFMREMPASAVQAIHCFTRSTCSAR